MSDQNNCVSGTETRQELTIAILNLYTVGPSSSDPFCMVNYYRQ